jgi:hypothetical protein
MGECQTDPPGTIVNAFPMVPFMRVSGLTHDGVRFQVLAGGRRVVGYDPWTGATGEEWRIDNDADRRAYGLAYLPDARFAVGAFDRFNPFTAADLELYAAGTLAESFAGEGGPAATDGTYLYVFLNTTQELVTLDAWTRAELERRAVSGLAWGDTFADLALDGYGGLWAVRPRQDFIPPMLRKIDLATASVSLDLEWLGGVVLQDGSLWGVGIGGFYQMVP